MEYAQGAVGRTFIARLHDGESIYESIEAMAGTEEIESAVVLALGGIRKGGVVTGPRDPSSLAEIVPQVERFDDAREMVGVGTLFPCEGRPSLHFHAGIGRGDHALVGCPREEAVCLLVLEVIVVELVGIDARRVADSESALHLLRILGKGRSISVPKQ